MRRSYIKFMRKIAYNNNPNNYSIVMDTAKLIIDLSNNIPIDEKNELKNQIDKVKNLLELKKIFEKHNLQLDGESFKILKKYYLEMLDNYPHYGPQTKRALRDIVELNISLKEMACITFFYLNNNNVSK